MKSLAIGLGLFALAATSAAHAADLYPGTTGSGPVEPLALLTCRDGTKTISQGDPSTADRDTRVVILADTLTHMMPDLAREMARRNHNLVPGDTILNASSER